MDDEEREPAISSPVKNQLGNNEEVTTGNVLKDIDPYNENQVCSLTPLLY